MILETTNPAETVGAVGGVPDALLLSEQRDHTTAYRAEKQKLLVRIGSERADLVVKGREAQTLALLLAKGPAGFTSGEASPLGWARRTSAYIRNLRLLGVPILTVPEVAVDGSRIGRYSLCGVVAVVEGGRA
jgi:hypothetical protein